MRRVQQLFSLPLLTITLLLTHSPAAALAAQQQPFLPAETATPTPGRLRAAAHPAHELLAARQTGGCIAGTNSCAGQGTIFNNICCADGQRCALDAANSPACCPSGAVCTGTAPASFSPPTTTPVSYVPNAYFSFPYIATSFSNAGACSRAVSQCSANYEACTEDLGGGGGGGGGAVTVVVPAGNGGMTTIGGNAGGTLPAATASSVCQSLSSVACYSIQGSYCEAGSTAGFTVGTANAAPTHMPCVGLVAGVAAGVGFGMMGM